MAGPLNSKSCILIGGNGNIGLQTLKALVNNGCTVAVIDQHFENIDKFLGKNKKNQDKIFLFKVDITKENDVKKSLNKIKSKIKKIDILINHSHYKGDGRKLNPKSNFFSPLENYPLSEWKKTIEVNLDGLFITTKVFGSEMIKQKSGIIINTSSTYGLNSPKPDIYGKSGINSPIGYATTKAAIINFTKYIAIHWAKYGIRANIISPGGISDPNQTRSFKRKYISNTPIGRMASKDDFSGAILYLCSDSSSYVTGSNLIIDGGWSSW